VAFSRRKGKECVAKILKAVGKLVLPWVSTDDFSPCLAMLRILKTAVLLRSRPIPWGESRDFVAELINE
jgi:hypothetical protein